MPIRKDEHGKRWVEMALVVPGTPEQAWRALATGPGNTAWFTKTRIEERVGGAIRFDFGPNGSSAGEVTAWEPPSRFGYVEREWFEGAPPVATEITLAARPGDGCLVRMTHALSAAEDDWDAHLEGFEQGWPAFFEVLRIYLAHFAGEKAASAFVMASVPADHLEVWKRLTASLGLAGANVGERRTTPAQPEALSGVVERIEQSGTQRYVMLRLDRPGPGVALIGTYRMGEATNASVALYLYGDDAGQRAAASEPRWQEWLGRVFEGLQGGGKAPSS